MSKTGAFALTACLLALAAVGCSGFAEGVGSELETDAGPTAKPKPKPTRPIPDDERPPIKPEPAVPDPPASTAGSGAPPKKPKPPPVETMPPEPEPTPIEDPNRDANIRFARTSDYDGYLTDETGRALYMFVGDVAGKLESACLDQCERDWPPFDVLNAKPSSELDPKEITRFHRQDGLWQTTYKGYQLYYRASEEDSQDVTADGMDSRWFVARDYLTFLASTRSFSPEGGMGTNSPYLTDGFGRTVYVCLEDTPRTDSSDAVSSCDAACTAKRPIFPAAATGRTTLLPSVINAGDLSELNRPDGQVQLTYRGWPLYFYSGDTRLGSTDGHNEEAWRAIDPISFALMPLTGD